MWDCAVYQAHKLLLCFKVIIENSRRYVNKLNCAALKPICSLEHTFFDLEKFEVRNVLNFNILEQTNFEESLLDRCSFVLFRDKATMLVFKHKDSLRQHVWLHFSQVFDWILGRIHAWFTWTLLMWCSIVIQFCCCPVLIEKLLN